MAIKNPIEFDMKQKEVNQLLKLQELFHSHYLTQELINGMIDLYVKFAQIIHHDQHPLRLYFMEKIKFVLSRPEIIRILEKKSGQEKQNKGQTGANENEMTEQVKANIKKILEEAKQEVRQNHNINKKERAYINTVKGEQLREKERNIKIQMQVQIMEQVEQNMVQLTKDFNDGEILKYREKEINKIIQKQDDVLNQRLAKRKKVLRKKSAELKEKEVIEIEAPPPLAKKELLQMKKELNQTYERFTRLTSNKTKRDTQTGKSNEGRVKLKIQQSPIYQEDIFDQLQKDKAEKQQPISFSKKKASPQLSPAKMTLQTTTNHNNQIPQVKQQNNDNKIESKEREADSSIEYKAFDQNKGRVTVRQKIYQQIEDEELF